MPDESSTIVDTFHIFVEAGDYKSAAERLAELHPADASDLLLSLSEAVQDETLLHLDETLIANLLEEMSQDATAQIARRLGPTRLVRILSKMYSDEATDLLQTLPEDEIDGLLDAMGHEGLDLRKLLHYAEETSGGLMATEFVAVRDQATVAQALQYLRTKAPDAETAYYLYVVDNQRCLVGIMSLRDLVIAAPQHRVKDLMYTDVTRVRVDQDQEEVARIFERYGYLTLPVVDEGERLVGIITVDDVLEVLENEATEDMYRMVGLVEVETVFSPLFSSVRKRLPWLFVNLITAMLAASTVSFFEGTIQQAVILATFLPIVAGMGGNAGTQTLTLIVRSIALGEVHFDNVKRALKKEVLLGLVNGAVVGAAVGLLSMLWKGNPILGIVLASALILNMALAGFVGVAVPMGLKALRIDPALASGIFVTTFTDVLGFFFFLGLASLVLTHLL